MCNCNYSCKQLADNNLFIINVIPINTYALFILITLQQVPTVDNESYYEAEMHVSGSDTESKGENEQQEEPSLDYYA